MKARAAAELQLADALNRLLDAGLSIREASERIGIGFHQARQLLRTWAR
jgi:transposase